MKNEKAVGFVFQSKLFGCGLFLIFNIFIGGVLSAQEAAKTATPKKENAVKTSGSSSSPSANSAPETPKADEGVVFEAPKSNQTTVRFPDAKAAGIAPVLIGYNDTIEVQFYKYSQFSGIQRVSANGTIRMPLIDQEIVAVCKTERQLTEELTALYRKYVRQPYINVVLRDHTSQPIAVIGKVEKPGTFQLTRRMRLLEVLALAGGPDKEFAGTKIQIARLGSDGFCVNPDKEENKNNLDGVYAEYNLKNLLAGDEKSNPYIMPGDVISVETAEKIYVVGNVEKPQPIKLEGPMTVTQAIAAAGGLKPSSKTSAVVLYRQLSPDSVERQEIIVDIDAINGKTKASEIGETKKTDKKDKKKKDNAKESKSENEELIENALALTGRRDPIVMPNDIIEVPIDGKKELRKNIFKTLLQGTPSILSGLLFRGVF